MSWGPDLDDGRRTIALTFENDDEVGLHLELYAINEKELGFGPSFVGDIYNPVDTRHGLLKRRIAALTIALVLLFVIFVAQCFWIRCLEAKANDDNQPLVLDQTERLSSDTDDSSSLDESMVQTKILNDATSNEEESIVLTQEISTQKGILESADEDEKESSSFDFSKYALASAMINSFFVGGLTFGYSGVVLMLRKEGVYAENCSCGSFW